MQNEGFNASHTKVCEIQNHLTLKHKNRQPAQICKLAIEVVPGIGLEPTRLSALAPETSASTISPSGLYGCKGK